MATDQCLIQTWLFGRPSVCEQVGASSDLALGDRPHVESEAHADSPEGWGLVFLPSLLYISLSSLF